MKSFFKIIIILFGVISIFILMNTIKTLKADAVQKDYLYKLNALYMDDLTALKNLDPNSEEARLRKRRMIMNKKEIERKIAQAKKESADEWTDKYRDGSGKLPGGFIEDSRSKVVKLDEKKEKLMDEVKDLNEQCESLKEIAKPVTETVEERVLRKQREFREKYRKEYGIPSGWSEQERKEYAKEFNKISEKAKEDWKTDNKIYHESMKMIGKKIKEIAEKQAELNFVQRRLKEEKTKIPEKYKKQLPAQPTADTVQNQANDTDIEIEPELGLYDAEVKETYLRFHNKGGLIPRFFSLDKEIYLSLHLTGDKKNTIEYEVTHKGYQIYNNTNKSFLIKVIDTWNGVTKDILLKKVSTNYYRSDLFLPKIFDAAPAHLLAAKFKTAAVTAKFEGKPREEDVLSAEKEVDTGINKARLVFEDSFGKDKFSYSIDESPAIALYNNDDTEIKTDDKGYIWAKVINVQNNLSKNILLIEKSNNKFISDKIAFDIFKAKAGTELVAKAGKYNASIKIYKKEAEKKKDNVKIDDSDFVDLDEELEISSDDYITKPALNIKNSKKQVKSMYAANENLYIELSFSAKVYEKSTMHFNYDEVKLVNTRNGEIKSIQVLENGFNKYRSWFFTPKIVKSKPGDIILAKHAAGLIATAKIIGPVKNNTKEIKKFRLRVVTKTGSDPKADMDEELRVYVLLDGNSNYKTELDNNNIDDFEPGAVDTFDLKFEYPLSEIHYIELLAKGTDEWYCNYITFQFIAGTKESRIYHFPVNEWIVGTKGRDKGVRGIPVKNFWMNPMVDGLN